MADPLTYFHQRQQDDWLLGQCSQAFVALVEQSVAELMAWCDRHPDRSPIVVVAESSEVSFLARFLAACLSPCHVFLTNPNWALTEWQQVWAQIQPDVVWGEVPAWGQGSPLGPSIASQDLPASLIMIPTGGSGGTVQFAMHTWETLMASVAGFCEYFAIESVNSFCVLPLYHVSGLMQFLRSLVSGGKLRCLSFKALMAANLADLPPDDFFLSLVPTQLRRLLQQPHYVDWLARFRVVLVGGASLSPDLRQLALAQGIPLAPTYGMTETASQVVTLPPAACASGLEGYGFVLPHAQIAIAEEGPAQRATQPGRIAIFAQSLALGYYPHRFAPGPFLTDDVGFWDAQGSLHVVGRNSNKIITGGENVFPAEVEAAILATNLVRDVSVVGVDDRHWGQAIVALYVPTSPSVSLEQLKSTLQQHLSRFKCPKAWLVVEQIPRNAQGKVNRQQVMAMARSATAPAIE